MKPSIEINNISKIYRRGVVRSYISLRDTLSNMFNKSLESKPFNALKNISFEVNSGEVLGIVGSNGAGKSTLLKILSRITPPSSGTAVIRGRVASLLEVGTGFHPELTGRENIYLNGSILGMTRKEVSTKFDEIVEFSGLEKFLDTPVKHYSSGMYTRLAFSVSAHLESEILLIDEVLAVGDAAFQKKCLGKMDDITKKQGRTIIFVSHNMGAIQGLCSRCVWLDKGKIKQIGTPDNVVKNYLSSKSESKTLYSFSKKTDKLMQIRKIKILNYEGNQTSYHEVCRPISIEMEYDVNKEAEGAHLGLSCSDQKDNYIFFSSDADNNPHLLESRKVGHYKEIFTFPANNNISLNKGIYYLRITLGIPESTIFDQVLGLQITIHDPATRPELLRNGYRPGIMLVDTKWQLVNL